MARPLPPALPRSRCRAGFASWIAAGCVVTAALAGGCSSPSRSPESDVVEVERIDLTAPVKEAPEEPVLPGAPSTPASAPPSAE